MPQLLADLMDESGMQIPTVRSLPPLNPRKAAFQWRDAAHPSMKSGIKTSDISAVPG
jgi:hypothetical protein